MKRRAISPIIIGMLFAMMSAGSALAHCEVPCGIYDDQLRASQLGEHITTIQKAMKEIKKLESKSNVNYNQLVRWINAKDFHANEFQEIVSQYFLTQRIKSKDSKYEEKLKTLHSMLVYAMKCKQTTDLENTEALQNLLSQFKKLYF